MEVHFIKLDNDEITEDNMKHKILVSSIKADAQCSLFALISKIYVPLLRTGKKENEKDDKSAQIRDTLYALRAGLHSMVRQGKKINLAKQAFSPDMFRGILVPIDEIEIWQEIESETLSQENEKLRRNAEIINKHFAPVEKLFRELPVEQLGTITGYIGPIEDALSSIWTDPDIFPPYP